MEKLKGFQTVKNRSCSEEIISDATVYSKNEVETKYPYIDGLKAINKRIVWGSRKIREPVRMINMIGEIMNLHPSGDSSIDQAIKRLSQPFKNFEKTEIIKEQYGGIKWKQDLTFHGRWSMTS